MDSTELKKRTQKFAIDVIKLAGKLPDNEIGKIFKKRIVASGTAAGAHYRVSLRGKSKADFISKVLEELDETQYWLEIIVLAELYRTEEISRVWDEAEALIKVFKTSKESEKS